MACNLSRMKLSSALSSVHHDSFYCCDSNVIYFTKSYNKRREIQHHNVFYRPREKIHECSSYLQVAL